MVSSTCLHFHVCRSGHNTCLTKFYQIYLALLLEYLAYLLWQSATPVPFCWPLGDYCCGNDYYPESTRESKQNRNTTGTRRTHIAHLGISSIIHAGESWVLKVLEHQIKCHPQLEMDWGLSLCCKSARILTLNVLLSMVKIEKEDAFCRRSMFVLF